MKAQALEKIDTLSTFLNQMKGLSNQLSTNPYAQGVDINKILVDVEDYLKEIKADVESIKEEAPVESAAKESEKAE